MEASGAEASEESSAEGEESGDEMSEESGDEASGAEQASGAEASESAMPSLHDEDFWWYFFARYGERQLKELRKVAAVCRTFAIWTATHPSNITSLADEAAAADLFGSDNEESITEEESMSL